MVELLDRAFPDLPGLNLVAYFFQILDEIQSDRKDIQLGIAQFDRMFLQQGVPLKKQRGRIQQKTEPKPNYEKEAMFSGPTVTQRKDLSSVIKLGLKVSDTSQSPETEGDEDPGHRLFDPETVDKGAPVEDPARAHVGEIAVKPDDEESSGYPDMDSNLPEIKDLEAPGPEAPPGIERGEDGSEQGLDQNQSLPEKGEPEEGLGVLTDDLIESQISEFEGRLSMACPLCSTGKVLEKETAKGKTYFHCSQEACNFISWGQPYHIECPLCKNPFLIEKAHKTGKPVLKCPRATCRYSQDIPLEAADTLEVNAQVTTTDAPKASAPQKKPRRKVRIRRVLRKKR